MMRRLLAVFTAAAATLAVMAVGPARGEGFAMVAQGECTNVRVRLQPVMVWNDQAKPPRWDPVPHRYQLIAPVADDCTRTHVEGTVTLRQNAHAKFLEHQFNDHQTSCAGPSGCWPTMCAGLASGNVGVDLISDSSNASTIYEVRTGGAEIRHVNPGNGQPSQLVLHARDTHSGVVAIAGRFTLDRGGCGSTWAEFVGEMLLFDPALDEG